jgi:hypothetical protein
MKREDLTLYIEGLDKIGITKKDLLPLSRPLVLPVMKNLRL